MSMLERLGEKVRNSPLLNRRGQAYSLTSVDDQDPFNRGIYFHVEFIGSETLPPSSGKGVELNDKAVHTIYSREKGPYRKFSVLVTDKSLRLKDLSTGQLVDDVPMYGISYCGTHVRYPRTFSFICRDSDSRQMRVHVMRAADKAKAQAMIVTVSKAFNIAYLAWQAKNKQRLRADSAERRAKGSDSPRATKKIQELNEAVAKKKAAEAKATEAQGAASVTQQLADASISGGAAKKKEEADDLEAMFTELAASRSQPDLLENDIGADPRRFSWDDTKEYADPGSTPNLLD